MCIDAIEGVFLALLGADCSIHLLASLCAAQVSPSRTRSGPTRCTQHIQMEGKEHPNEDFGGHETTVYVR